MRTVPEAPIASSRACTSRGTTTGNSPFFNELFLKMSAKLVEMTALNPYCVSAHGACSRDDPQPKLSPARSTWHARAAAWFRMNSGFGRPSAS
jgi:hypothetical protein